MWLMVLLTEVKFILAPLFATGVLFGNVAATLPDAVRVALDLAALAILFAGFLVLGKLRAQAVAAEGAAKAWREERDAIEVKAERLQETIISMREEAAMLRQQNLELASRPTLDALVAQIAELQRAVHELAAHVPYIQPKEGP